MFIVVHKTFIWYISKICLTLFGIMFTIDLTAQRCYLLCVNIIIIYYLTTFITLIFSLLNITMWKYTSIMIACKIIDYSVWCCVSYKTISILSDDNIVIIFLIIWVLIKVIVYSGYFFLFFLLILILTYSLCSYFFTWIVCSCPTPLSTPFVRTLIC